MDYLCNLLVPGFPKCGTTSFHALLSQHPSICMSEPKECHFFARQDIWERGVSYHNSLFAHAVGEETYFGESSTIYCVSLQALRRIQDSLGGPKVILLVRNPIERAISHYTWLFRLGVEKRSLKEALAQDGLAFDPHDHVHGLYKAYLLFSRYSEFIPLWFQAFGTGNVLTVRADRLRLATKLELNRVFTFLGLQPLNALVPVSHNVTANHKPLAQPTLPWSFGKTLVPKRLRLRWRRSWLVQSTWRYLHRGTPREPPLLTDGEYAILWEQLGREVEYWTKLA